MFLKLIFLLVQYSDGRGTFVTGHAQLARDGLGVELVVELAYPGQREIGESVRVNAENEALLVDQREMRIQRR